ncbi:MAG: pyridoxal phosphate-dependent decarboxylase family protein [Actinomycetota bacterium]
MQDLNWPPDEARAFADGIVDIWTDLLRALPDARVTPAQSQASIDDAVRIPVPEKPMPREDLLAYLRDVALNQSMYPGHAGFMAYISGAGTVPGAAAELLAAGLNQNVGGWRLSPAASSIETHLISWLCEQFGLPKESGGLLCSGGAMASFIGLKAARDFKAGYEIRERGVQPGMIMYASAEVHDVNMRAADMLGLGTSAVRFIPTDDAFQMRTDLLRSAIQQDRAAGLRPFAVVATAGTVATGAIDPLNEIAAICKELDLWMHVDGAYGGPAVLAPDLRPLLAGIEHADSIAFDPHKWLYTPHSAGCALVRDKHMLIRAFELHPAYIHEDKDRTGHPDDFLSLGPQFSRGFQALKLWVSLLAHGTRAYGERISHDAELARHLVTVASARDDFEVVAPSPLSIACFRYKPADLDSNQQEYLNALNERLMTEMQLDGRVFISNAVLNGRFVLRICIVNFRTEASDVERVLSVAAELGAALDRTMRPQFFGSG